MHPHQPSLRLFGLCFAAVVFLAIGRKGEPSEAKVLLLKEGRQIPVLLRSEKGFLTLLFLGERIFFYFLFFYSSFAVLHCVFCPRERICVRLLLDREWTGSSESEDDESTVVSQRNNMKIRWNNYLKPRFPCPFLSRFLSSALTFLCFLLEAWASSRVDCVCWKMPDACPPWSWSFGKIEMIKQRRAPGISRLRAPLSLLSYFTGDVNQKPCKQIRSDWIGFTGTRSAPPFRKLRSI